MWYKDANTSIDDMTVRAIVESLTNEMSEEDDARRVTVNSTDLTPTPLEYIESSATRYPVVFIIDTSTSLSLERENLNRAMNTFINNILDSSTSIASSLDFAIVCFNDVAYVKRKFGFLTEADRNLHNSMYLITQDEMVGKTNMASGLFLAWYLSEVRKQQYKTVGLDYRQPIFVLISDLQSNEKRTFQGMPFVNSVIYMYNTKSKMKKLALLKTLYGTISPDYDRTLEGIRIDATSSFSSVLEKTFKELIKSLRTPDEEYFEPDDDAVFFDFSEEEAEINHGDSSIFDAITDLFNSSDYS